MANEKGHCATQWPFRFCSDSQRNSFQLADYVATYQTGPGMVALKLGWPAQYQGRR
jgi:hypothetical protein